MFRFLSVLAVLGIIASPAFAQSDYLDRHETTDQPSFGCYQIVQSQKARRWTFRLNRCTGDVDQLVADSEGEISWESMSVGFKPDLSGKTVPRFTMFLSGWSAADMFLIDTSNGATWNLTQADVGSTQILFWRLITDPPIGEEDDDGPNG